MHNSDLTDLGFAEHFQSQISPQERASCDVARVIEVQRAAILVCDGTREWPVALGAAWQRRAAEQRPTVGDWVLINPSSGVIERVLDRKSVFRRIAAGERAELQLIASNLDTLFIVTSCNDDFNESRLERYVSLALEAHVTPVIVITKIDLVETTDTFRERARGIQAGIAVELVNALEHSSMGGVLAWIGSGQTVAFVGSSGVGKSTLINTLLGRSVTPTAPIREDDSRGRHTTSFRSLYRLPDGGLLIDVPGMRELKVAEVAAVLDDVFADIAEAAVGCRFSDCSHTEEPGCGVRAAVADGRIDPRRLRSYFRLQREDARHSASLAERREQARRIGKLYKSIQQSNRRRRNPPEG